MSVEPSEQTQKRTWPFRKKYGLALAFAALWLIFWALQFWTQWHEYVNEQQDHSEPAKWGPYLWQFAARTLENNQSEMFQVLMFVTFAGLFYQLGSSESKDSEERIEAKIDQLLRERKKED